MPVRPRSIGVSWPRLALLIFTAALATSPPAIADQHAANPEADAPTVQWGEQTFTTDTHLARWLRARGADYDSWAQAHLKAAAILEGRAVPPEPQEPARQAPTWTPFNLPEGATAGRNAVASSIAPGAGIEPPDTSAASVAPRRILPPFSTPSPGDGTLLHIAPPHESGSINGVALALLVTGGTLALVLLIVAGVPNVPSFRGRSPSAIIDHRLTLGIVGVEILVFFAFLFVITVGVL